MATGTGKTLLCAALIRRFLLTHNAERVLFIVDRIELAKQTMEDFATILAEFKPVVFKTARKNGKLLGSSVVVATIQSLMPKPVAFAQCRGRGAWTQSALAE